MRKYEGKEILYYRKIAGTSMGVTISSTNPKWVLQRDEIALHRDEMHDTLVPIPICFFPLPFALKRERVPKAGEGLTRGVVLGERRALRRMAFDSCQRS